MGGIGVGADNVVAGVIIVIIGTALIGCRANPVFAVDDDDEPATSTTASSTGSTTRPDQTSLSSADTTDSGADSTTANASAASETSTGAPDPGDTTTGAPDTDSSASTGDDDSTTGEVEQEIYDLHDRCDLEPDTVWIAEYAGVIDDIPCHTTDNPPPPPWAGYLFDFEFADVLEPRVVHMMPQQKPGAQVTGDYNGLQLGKPVSPHLRAVLVCPGDPCSIIGSVRVEDLNNEPIVGQEEIPLGPGQMQVVDLDLGDFVDQLSKQEFRVVLAVTGQDGSGGDRGVWVRPRIVDVQ